MKFPLSFQTMPPANPKKENKLWVFFISTGVAVFAAGFWMICALALALSGSLAYAMWLRGQAEAFGMLALAQQNNADAAGQEPTAPWWQQYIIRPAREFFPDGDAAAETVVAAEAVAAAEAGAAAEAVAAAKGSIWKDHRKFPFKIYQRLNRKKQLLCQYPSLH